jgi:hypothetical protein
MWTSKIIQRHEEGRVVVIEGGGTQAFSGRMHLHRSPDEKNKSNEDKLMDFESVLSQTGPAREKQASQTYEMMMID